MEAEWVEAGAELDAAAIEAIRMLDEAGGPMGAGSDLIGENQDIRAWEISLKAEIIGVRKAIESATAVNAAILGIDHLVGTIEEGKVADIVVFDEDPLADHRVFREQRPSLVVHLGKVVRGAGAAS